MDKPVKQRALRLQNVDQELMAALEMQAAGDEDYWSFRDNASREHAHSLFQYPAMMVPQMLESLFEAVVDLQPKVTSVFDPFVGSGTVLTESMKLGLEFAGIDINPLAILLCRVKSGPFYLDALESHIEEVKNSIRLSRAKNAAVDFPGRDKWFTKKTVRSLSKIRRAIMKQGQRWVRRFLWVALAETVRLTSNSRTSTFKLHIRSGDERRKRRTDPIEIFEKQIDENLERFKEFRLLLSESDLLRKGRYIQKTDISLQDATDTPDEPGDAPLYDLLITSPPYGDNKTTVPYGQHSYLPLQWIELSDIDEGLDDSCLNSTHEIDSRSLGGKLRGSLESAKDMRSESKSLTRILKALKHEPKDRSMRVAAYFRDLNHAVVQIESRMNNNGYMFWTVGSRNVGGESVPIEKILIELLQSRGAEHVTSLKRRIPVKRMALRNNISSTMQSESIVVFRKRA